VDTKKLLEKLSLTDFPVGIGGCKNSESFECCEYNVTVFDNKSNDESIIEYDETKIKLHHGSLNETSTGILVQYDSLKIIHDEQWELQMFLSKIKEKKERIFKNYINDCLVEAIFCITKAKQDLKNSNPFASCWQKCSAFLIADAISVMNSKRPSPTHMLDNMRKFQKTKINENISVVTDCIGIERSTVSLLSRMCKSTMGFSDMVEKNHHSEIIKQKHDYLVKNSLLSDCYFYLGYINKKNIIKIKDTINKKPDLKYVLQIAFDLDKDLTKVEQQTDSLHKTANNLISSMNA